MFLKGPQSMKMLLERRDKSMYCHFHHDYDHDIEDCCDLKERIEELIHRDTSGGSFGGPGNLCPDLKS